MRKIFFLQIILSLFFYLSKAQNCNNWLYTPSNPSYAEMGQINIIGNKITVEATINRTTSYSGGLLYAGDIVSKHNTPADVNYLLRPNTAEITTSNGYFRTPDICEIELNKTYHVAMVYDGATLKFYRNGFLMSQIAASGNLFQNTWKTRIGFYEPQAVNTNFIGYINEVRIWNVAKNQAEIKSYMNSALPNPTSQFGLVAYYTFDNLINKQGNPTFNGMLGGAASITQTNTNCNFVIDSCAITLNNNGISGIINDYTPVISLTPCSNKLTVEDATKFNPGDTVLIIQMKGAIIDSTNTSAFGTIINYNNAGNYEFNYVKSKSGNIVELENTLTRQYDIPMGKVQLIRVPYYNSADVTNTLSCLPWDGQKGGVLVLNVRDTINLNADLDVSGKGFKGGNGIHAIPTSFNCYEIQYSYTSNTDFAADKGESIAEISSLKSAGKGKNANGGGGGNSHNAGGGGGSNASSAGFGGYQFEGAPCNSPAPFDNRGVGGTGLTYTNAVNKVFLGGGGGAGHGNNPELFYPNGGNGGGIIIVMGNVINGNNKNIIANGDNGLECTGYGASGCHEGMGGGGGGGAILLNVNTYNSVANTFIKGGKGADMVQAGNLKVGPGGGGSGGICWINNVTRPVNLNIDSNAGTNGVCTNYSNDPWGAEAGQNGMSLFNLVVPVDTNRFTPNIDSIRIKDSVTSCQSFDFKGLAFTSKLPITQWHWDFGDNNTAITQNTAHNYNLPGTYLVKLIATDINGCKDSITKSITITSIINFDFSYQQSICNPLSVQFFNIGNTPGNTYWSFGDGSSVTGNATPTHLYGAPGNYIVKYNIQNGACIDTVTKTISINTLWDDMVITPDTLICFKSTKQLFTKPALSFCWSPVTYLNDPTSPNPITSAQQPITYYFTSEVAGNNIITNGDFNIGNTGFTSQYNFVNTNTTEGEYFVGPNPQAWNTFLSNCPDHTSGTGNMMLVNGAPVADVNVWTQVVPVTPNTNYAFSTWIQALYSPNPAQLSFSINGGTLGNLITASLPTCTWNQFYATWNSGNNTTATIAIVNKNTFVQGNDFALDDISFSPVLIKRDSVKISIDTPYVKTIADTATCLGKAVQLNSTGAVTYSWLPSSGLDNDTNANPLATPANTTQYIVSGTNASGCTATDTVNIIIKQLPLITKSSDSTICRNVPVQLFASGGNSYSWLPVGSLNNPSIANPVASPLVNTTYQVTVTAANNCSKTDSVKIAIHSLPVFSVSPDKSTCVTNNNSLTASGGTLYLWSPAALVDNPNIATPVSNATITTTFTVKIKDGACNDSTVLSTKLTILPGLKITATKSNDIDCVLSSAQLTASGALMYIWSPAIGLSNAAIPNPLASITSTQQYIVTGTDSSTNCTGTATITLAVKPPANPTFFVPNAFSPNGDGKNDCFRVRQFGTVKSVDFSIYNRVGNLIFHTLNVNDCWDGTYKGNPADPGNYVYYIKTFNNCGENIKKGNLILIR